MLTPETAATDVVGVGVGGAEMPAAVADTAAARARVLGFPAATDIDYRHTGGLLAGLVNHLGDPEVPGRWPVHLLDWEREVIATSLRWFGGEPDSCWGYVTAGGSSEGVLHGMWLGRERFPDPPHVYASTAAHYCVAKAARLLGLPLTRVATDAGGAMRPEQLAAAVKAREGRAVLLVATVGTTMTEAVDDLPALHAALDAAGAVRRHVVVDAALSGPMLALAPNSTDSTGSAGGGLVGVVGGLLGGGVGCGAADAVCFSGHKFLGTPIVCGVTLTRRVHSERVARRVAYIGSRDVTVSGSRSGLSVAQLWWALHRYGPDRLRARAVQARAVAANAVTALCGIGWNAWRHSHACTEVLDPAPPEPITRRWALPVAEGRSHLVCVPGVTDERVTAFVTDLAAADDSVVARRSPTFRQGL